jgi:polyisoprenoid-binding protein YceI
MKRALLALVAAVVLVGIGVVVWFYASTGLDEDTEVTAPPLEASPTDATPATSPDTTGPDPETTMESTVNTTSGPETTQPAGGGVFELADGTEARFELDEELRGQPTRVVATNPEVAGQLRFDPDDLAATEIGTIVVSSQTFTTDQGNRDRAIRGPILDSSVEPTIEFVPTSVDGLDGSVGVGDTVEFTVDGDLTIRGITNPVTFDAEATYAAEDRLDGTVSTTVLRSDFDLQIPSVATVANVSDEVLIALDFVALPAA